MPPSPRVNLLLQWHASLRGVISNNLDSLPYKCLWVMHIDVIQIIKHNGDTDAFPQLWLAALGRHDATSQPSSPTLPFWKNPAFPISSFWNGRARAAEPPGWVVSFPQAFATRIFFFSFFLFPQDLNLSQPAQRRRFITCHNDAGLPVWKQFKVRGLEISTPSLFPAWV